MSKSIAIMQPYFLPYIGYWQMMKSVNTFILYDDVNYIKKGWINRNRILLNEKAHYITIPLVNASQNSKICDLNIVRNRDWQAKILQQIKHAYSKAPFYPTVFPLIEEVVMYACNSLAEYVCFSIQAIHKYLDFETKIIKSSSIYNNSHLKGSERIVDICRQEKASSYINAEGGKALYQASEFADYGIELKFINTTISHYKQLNNQFIGGLSVLDVLMFNQKESIAAYLDNFELEVH